MPLRYGIGYVQEFQDWKEPGSVAFNTLREINQPSYSMGLPCGRHRVQLALASARDKIAHARFSVPLRCAGSELILAGCLSF